MKMFLKKTSASAWTHEDIDAQIAAIQAKRASRPVEDEDVPKENERVGMGESGVFDQEIYGGKGKFEGYVTSIATKEADDDEEEDSSANGGGRQRASYTAPLSLLNDVAQSNEDYA